MVGWKKCGRPETRLVGFTAHESPPPPRKTTHTGGHFGGHAAATTQYTPTQQARLNAVQENRLHV